LTVLEVKEKGCAHIFIHQCCSENMSAQEHRQVTIWRNPNTINTAEMLKQFDVHWLYHLFRVAAIVQLLAKTLLKSKLDLDQLTKQITCINQM